MNPVEALPTACAAFGEPNLGRCVTSAFILDQP